MKHVITLWDESDQHYKTFDTDEIMIDGETIDDRDIEIVTDFATRIGERIDKVASEPNYQHEYEDWHVGLYIAMTQVDDELKEFKNEVQKRL